MTANSFGSQAALDVAGEQYEIFFGDRTMQAAWHKAKRQLAAIGSTLVEIDMQPFHETAKLLYEGPWVAERHAAIEAFFADHADAMVEVTRRIIEGARKFSATDSNGNRFVI